MCDVYECAGKSYVKENFETRRELLRRSFTEIEGKDLIGAMVCQYSSAHMRAGQFFFAVSLITSETDEIGVVLSFLHSEFD